MNKITRLNEAIGSGKAGPGRPNGSKNQVTNVLSEAILLAGKNVGDGSLVAYLENVARDHPTAFVALLGKLLPRNITAELNHHEQVTVIELISLESGNREESAALQKSQN